MNTISISREQTAGTRTGRADWPTYAVVGLDGSAPSLRALDTAARLLNDRPGGMEIVYVAHQTPAAAATGESFDDTARSLSEQVRTRLRDARLRAAAQRWHFQRRDGAIADSLVAVADEVRQRHGAEADVFLVVGRSEHGYHHVLGSVPAALERQVQHPVIVIP